MNLRALAPVALLPLLSLANGCSADDAPANDKVAMASSSLSRDLAPEVPSSDAEELRAGNTAFATDLYATLRTSELQGKNLFFSPLSISTAIAMVHAGARGNTESQIASTLHYTLPQEKLHPALNALDLALSSRKDVPKKGEDDGGVPFQLNVVNSSWGEKEMTFRPAYLDTLATNYGAGVRLTDFLRDAEGARKTINGWVESQTNDKIKNLLPESSITPDTRLVLVNAVYFNAGWDHPFEASATNPAVFHGKGGDASVPTMHQTTAMGYAEGEGWKAAELTFAAGQVAFDIVVPDAIDDFEGSLDAAKIASIAGALKPESVTIDLPKFKIEGASFSLKDALEARGMVDAFQDGVADFSGISEVPLYVSDVIHQAFVSVEEKGVEAAAATAVIANEFTAAPADPKKLGVDKPFVFFIRDVPTGAVIFVGRVLDLQG